MCVYMKWTDGTQRQRKKRRPGRQSHMAGDEGRVCFVLFLITPAYRDNRTPGSATRQTQRKKRRPGRQSHGRGT